MDEVEIVTIRPVQSCPDDDTKREVRISCPDATGLGCDITRMLMDFGLRILQGDVSTDGKWCFLIFKVQLTGKVPPHWSLLQARLQQICPMSGTHTHTLWRLPSGPKDYLHPFLLQVKSYDRLGVLHDLMHSLWESDVVVFKAHITTGPSSDVLDMFWFYDNRGELPNPIRAKQIIGCVRACLHSEFGEPEVEIAPAPADTCAEDSASAAVRRCACKDATAASPLRTILSYKKKRDGSVQLIATEQDEFGQKEEVQVMIDSCTTTAYSMVNVFCMDRKGLFYDLMRTLKDVHVSTAYAKISVRPDNFAEIDLYLQEPGGGRISDSELEDELVERIRCAVSLPVQISVKDVYDDTCTELMVSAHLDSGGRGRPRVTYDVTAALNSIGICVFMADVYIEDGDGQPPPSDDDVARRPRELHRFLVSFADGCRLQSASEKKEMYDVVRNALAGRSMGAQTSPSKKHATSNRHAAARHQISLWPKW